MAKNRIEFWFKDRNDLYRQLPVNPEEIDYSSPYGMNTVSITNLGDVAIPGERGLKQITFSSFFPKFYNPSYCEYEGGPSPWEWVKRIELWRDERRNIRLIITGTPISIPVFISEFTINPERAGHPGDIYYTITLLEYRPTLAKITEQKPTANTAATTESVVPTKKTNRPPSEKTASKTYTVKSGDTLWKIAKSLYGDGSKYKTIYDANKKVIGKNPDIIKPGQKLVIP